MIRDGVQGSCRGDDVLSVTEKCLPSANCEKVHPANSSGLQDLLSWGNVDAHQLYGRTCHNRFVMPAAQSGVKSNGLNGGGFLPAPIGTENTAVDSGAVGPALMKPGAGKQTSTTSHQLPFQITLNAF